MIMYPIHFYHPLPIIGWGSRKIKQKCRKIRLNGK